MSLGMEVGHIVLGGTQFPLLNLLKTGTALPIFVPCLLWLNGLMDQDVTWYEARPRPRPHCARWGPSSPPPKKGGSFPKFSAHVCCSRTTRWIKMSLGTIVSLGLGNIVLDVDRAPPQGAQPPLIFGPCLLCQRAEWIKMPLGTKVSLSPDHIVLHVT